MTLPNSLIAQTACILEATARKPGNVHRYQDFADVTYLDFLLSAAAIAPVMDEVAQRGVGPSILEAVRRTRQVVKTNTNLGIILLLTPLAAVPNNVRLKDGIETVLQLLTVADSKAVYEAIRLAQPGGMGDAPKQDIADEPTLPLREIMKLAAERDMIALQYVNGFQDVFSRTVSIRGMTPPGGELNLLPDWEGIVIECHLQWMAAFPDSLIARKRGLEEARESRRRAAKVLAGRQKIAALDAWLRAVGHERNPGTSADLVTASLFVALREDRS